MEPRDWDAVVGPHVVGRQVILAGGPVAQWTDRVRDLQRLGAARVLVMGTGSVGTGPLPPEDFCEWFVVDIPAAPTLIERIRLGNKVLAAPPASAIARLDLFDPGRTAVVMGDFLNAAPSLAGRPFLASRRAEWVALEDKVTVDALWDRAGVARAACEVIPGELPGAVAAALAAAHRIDDGAGVVFAGDAREGWHGGASLVRWADSPALIEAAVTALALRCDSLRVMPYLPGVPCSIHGVVMPDGVAVVRPVEMVVLRKPDGTFFYAGCATFFDPSDAIRDEMQSAARRVGELLRSEVGFRGAFTVDGVATAEGFLPTELNPRNGAGLTVVARGTGLPIQLLLDLIVAGETIGMSARELEDVLVTAADLQRTGGTWASINGVEAEPCELRLVADGDGFREASATETPHVTMTVGPAPGGTFVRTVFEPAFTPVGPSVGDRAAAVWRCADERLGFDVGDLWPAQEEMTRQGVNAPTRRVISPADGGSRTLRP